MSLPFFSLVFPCPVKHLGQYLLLLNVDISTNLTLAKKKKHTQVHFYMMHICPFYFFIYKVLLVLESETCIFYRTIAYRLKYLKRLFLVILMIMAFR